MRLRGDRCMRGWPLYREDSYLDNHHGGGFWERTEEAWEDATESAERHLDAKIELRQRKERRLLGAIDAA